MKGTLRRFTDGLRVRIVDHDSFAELNGRTGVVVRRLHSTSEAAWIKMDEPLPDNRRSFTADDPRADHTKVYLDECDPVHGERIA